MNRKKIVSLLAAMALAVSLVPLGARAVEVQSDTTIWNNETYTVTGTVEIASRVSVSGNVTLTLKDGCELTVNGGIGVPENASLTIEGTGKLTANSTNSSFAGIGGNGSEGVGAITINGGTVIANGAASVLDGSAGIGGGAGEAGGTLTINGGTINATAGNNAAAIGGGTQGGCGTILIHDGAVTANGTGNGPGIGTGATYGRYGSITITGGTVTATGGANGAAGIGGAYGGNASTITITGGTVTAQGGDRGAGIGGGQYSHSGEITISGGTVTATGGTGGAGIGNGANCYSGEGSLAIQGGVVTATGGDGAADIGGGRGNTFSNQLTVSPDAIIHADLTKKPTATINGILNDGSGSYTVYGNATLSENLTIDSGKTLNISNGATLTIPAGVTLTNNGTIENKGHIENKGAITSNGTFTNDGTILNRGTITGDVTGSGTVTVPSTSSGPTTYAITVADGENGTVTASAKRSAANRTVKLTVTPHQGYRLDSLTVTDGKGGSVAVTEGEKGEYTFSMPRSAVTVTGTFVPDLPFVDVPADAYYRAAVKWALDNGVTTGTDETHFSPDATCTRGQVVTFLWRAKGEPAPQSANNPFADVSTSDYYYNAVLWAAEQGITTGTGPHRFSPDQTCTRAHIVTFLWRCEGRPDDAGSSGWYTDAVNWAQANDLLSGSGRAFVPGDDCPRADVVDYLYRDLVR